MSIIEIIAIIALSIVACVLMIAAIYFSIKATHFYDLYKFTLKEYNNFEEKVKNTKKEE